jgi:hypothetical protein
MRKQWDSYLLITHGNTYMNAYPALTTAGIIFGIIALMHVLRLFYQTEVRIAGKVVPLWVSIIAFIIPGMLSIWMLMISFG